MLKRLRLVWIDIINGTRIIRQTIKTTREKTEKRLLIFAAILNILKEELSMMSKKVRYPTTQMTKPKNKPKKIYTFPLMEAIKEEFKIICYRTKWVETRSLGMIWNVRIGRAADGLYNIPADIDEALSLLKMIKVLTEFHRNFANLQWLLPDFCGDCEEAHIAS